MTVKDEWVRAALTDDMVVVELLIRLKQSQAVSVSLSPKSKSHQSMAMASLSWGLKRRRSKAAAAAASSPSHCDGAVSGSKDGDFTRFSPTTPLSWSGGASPSATADGYEESSRLAVLPHHAAARFKATTTSDFTSNSASTKKCKRKKTFAELKEEETSLRKERTCLKEEIANLNATVQAERAKHENLKRIKIDMGLKCEHNSSSTSGQPHQRILQGSTNVTEEDSDPRQAASDCRARKAESTGESFFLIPDLNMMPSEEASSSDVLCGMS